MNKKEEEEIKESIDETEKTANVPAVFDEDKFNNQRTMGMSNVDPADIRPPQILLIQKSSELNSFVSTEQENPKIGEFFHNGKMEIYKSFECYFIFAAKSTYVDKRKEGRPTREQYKAVAVLAKDMSIFGMLFRSSALYALSPLFTASVAMRRPIYAIKVFVETKTLSGDKGEWTIPVIRVLGPENDPEKLGELEELAQSFDKNADRVQETGNDPEDLDAADFS
jgi:hypothetical protein